MVPVLYIISHILFILYLGICTSQSHLPKLPPHPSPHINHQFTLYIHESASVLLYSLVCFIVLSEISQRKTNTLFPFTCSLSEKTSCFSANVHEIRSTFLCATTIISNFLDTFPGEEWYILWPQNIFVLILSVNLWKSHLILDLFLLLFVFIKNHGNEGEVKTDSTLVKAFSEGCQNL